MAENEKKPSIDAGLWEAIRKTEKEMTPPPGFDLEALVAKSSKAYWAAAAESLAEEERRKSQSELRGASPLAALLTAHASEVAPTFRRVISNLNTAAVVTKEPTKEIRRDALLAVAPMFFISAVIVALWASGDAQLLRWVLPVCAGVICLATFVLIYKFVREVNSSGRFSLWEERIGESKTFLGFVYKSGGAVVGGAAGVVLLTAFSLFTTQVLRHQKTEKQDIARVSARTIATDKSREEMAKLQSSEPPEDAPQPAPMLELPPETVEVKISTDNALSVTTTKVSSKKVEQTITAKDSATKDVFPDTYHTVLSDFEGTLYQKSEGETTPGEELVHFYIGTYDKVDTDGLLHVNVLKSSGDSKMPVFEGKKFPLDAGRSNISRITSGESIFVAVDAKTNEARAVPFPAAKRNVLFRSVGPATKSGGGAMASGDAVRPGRPLAERGLALRP